MIDKEAIWSRTIQLVRGCIITLSHQHSWREGQTLHAHADSWLPYNSSINCLDVMLGIKKVQVQDRIAIASLNLSATMHGKVSLSQILCYTCFPMLPACIKLLSLFHYICMLYWAEKALMHNDTYNDICLLVGISNHLWWY